MFVISRYSIFSIIFSHQSPLQLYRTHFFILIFVYLDMILIFVLQVDHNALADNLLQLASSSDLKAFNRKILMNLVKK